MNNETLLPKKIARLLDESLDLLPPRICEDLARSRQLALKRMPAPRDGVFPRSAIALCQVFFFRKAALGALCSGLLLVAAAGQYAHIQDSADQAAIIDEEILSGAAPVQAYTDPAFSLAFRAGEIPGADPSQ